MATLADSVEGLYGGALVSAVFAFGRHGNPSVRSFVETVMDAVAEPVYGMIRKWVFDGELPATQSQRVLPGQSEFFVVAAGVVADGADGLWAGKYQLHKRMLPSFITPALARKIMLAGKSINFIRQCCADNEWLIDRAATADAVASTLATSGHTKHAAVLDAAVSHAAKSASGRVIQLLMERFRLMDHLRALKQFLLLGQGDFIQYLMDLLGPELCKSAQEIYRHNLMSVLEQAVRSSNAQFEDQDILDHLDITLMEPSPGDAGWDIFSLNYTLDVNDPVAAVVGPDEMQTYMQVFTLLWRLKRVEYSLSNTWKSHHTDSNRVLKEMPRLSGVLHKCYLLRHQMIHFTMNLHNYIMFEVLESSWELLVEQISKATDLDEVITAHKTYLTHVRSKALMQEEPSLPLLQQVTRLFDVIITFSATQEKLMTTALAEVQRRQATAAQRDLNTQLGQWGTSYEQERSEIPVAEDADRRVGKAAGAIDTIHEAFQQQFAELLNTIDASSGEGLRFLSFRIDFNQYYHKKQTTGGVDHSEFSVR